VDHRVGTTLRGKYLLERVLGAGSMGTVFAATHRNGMPVAIKVLNPDFSRNADVLRRFVREGYIANRVKHPGVVKIIDDDVDEEGTAFLVMELLEGRTLDAEWMEQGRSRPQSDGKDRLPPERVSHVVIQLLDVLAAIHAEGIVHRDVKPENVFLTKDGGLKVLDLGIARVIESRTQTKLGILMGTPGFVAPEQALGNAPAIDARTDVFSVGALMFATLTGEVIHPGATPMEQMVLAASKPARSLRSVMPEASPVLAHVVDTALAFDKEKRFSSALEMKSALEVSMGSQEASVPFLLVRK